MQRRVQSLNDLIRIGLLNIESGRQGDLFSKNLKTVTKRTPKVGVASKNFEFQVNFKGDVIKNINLF